MTHSGFVGFVRQGTNSDWIIVHRFAVLCKLPEIDLIAELQKPGSVIACVSKFHFTSAKIKPGIEKHAKTSDYGSYSQ